MTQQTATRRAGSNSAVVEKFLYALRDKDFDTVEALMADDIVYENYGYTRIRSRRRIAKMFRAMERPSIGFDVRLHRNVEQGSSVLNERTDALIAGPVRIVFTVCGVFDVHDGRITFWRDYFDLFDYVKGFIRGIVAVALPSLQRKF